MNKKKLLITALVLAVLAALVYFQVRTWRKFDWHRFWLATGHTQKGYLLLGVFLVYLDYLLRAVRWKMGTLGSPPSPATSVTATAARACGAADSTRSKARRWDEMTPRRSSTS